MYKDSLDMRGHVKYDLFDEFGNIKQSFETANTVTELHDAVIAQQARLGESGVTVIGWIDFGTGTGQGSSDTTLDTVITEARIGVSKATAAGGDDNDLVVYATVAAGEYTATINEAGLFRGKRTANMMCYDDNSASGLNINKGATDTLAITWTITYGSS